MIDITQFIVKGILTCWMLDMGEYTVVRNIEPESTKKTNFLYSSKYSKKVEIVGYDMTGKVNLCKVIR